MENQNTTTVPDIVNNDKVLVPVMAHVAHLALAQLTNPAQAAVGAAFSGKCYCYGGMGYCHCDFTVGAKEGCVMITANAIFIISRESATYQSEVLLGWEPAETLLREDKVH